MKKWGAISILFLVGFSGQVQALMNCKNGDSEAVADATHYFNQISIHFQDGYIPKYDLLRATIFLEEAKLCSQAINAQQFCDKVQPLVSEMATMSRLLNTPERIQLSAEIRKVCPK